MCALFKVLLFPFNFAPKPHATVSIVYREPETPTEMLRVRSSVSTLDGEELQMPFETCFEII